MLPTVAMADDQARSVKVLKKILAGGQVPRDRASRRENLQIERLGLFFFFEQKTLGPDHPQVAASLENYALLLRKLKRGGEASRLEARAKEIQARHARENTAE